MRLSRFIQRMRALGDAEVLPEVFETIEGALAEGADLAELLRRRPTGFPNLSPRLLLGIWRAHRLHVVHLALLKTVTERRRQASLPPIAPAVLAQTVWGHEVSVLERAEALAPPGGAAEHRRRDGLKEAVTVWNACLAIARREGQLVSETITEDAALQDEFGALADRGALGEIAAHRWLAMRRGEAAGALDLSLDLPIDRLVAQVDARRGPLSPLAGGRSSAELLDELVLVDLERCALELKDAEAERAAIQSAAEAYLGLLTTPPVEAAMVAGVWVPKRGGQLAVAVVRDDGELVHQDKAHPGQDPVAAVEQCIGAHPAEAVVLPTSSEDADLLNALASGFGPALPVVRCEPTAMGESIKHVTEPVPPAVARAVVLARRAVQPQATWAQPDPVSLGLVESQHDLDAGNVRLALDDMRVLALAGVKPEDLARPAGDPSRLRRAGPRVPVPPLNPLVKSVDDLRPGMKINGVVTNITQFGAFINVGLSHEGLVHVSELADHFVQDPNEVVRVGQTVTARVLGVDRGRGRISLSLKPERERPISLRPETEGDGKGRVLLDDIPGRGRRASGPRGAGFGGGNRQPATGNERVAALAELEALFEKNKK